MANVNREDIEEFLKEGREYFEEVEPLLIELLGNDNLDDSAEIVATAFRIFHSVKGVSGFLSFTNIQNITHRVEEILDNVRSRKIVLTKEILNLVFEALDFIKGLFDLVDVNNSDLGPEDEIESLISRLVAILDASLPSSKIDTQFDTAESLLLDCFTNIGFYSEFKQELNSLISDLETGIFSLLDKPKEASSIIQAALFDIEKIQFNAQIFNLHFCVEICKSYRVGFVKFLNDEVIKPEKLGVFFQLIAFLKEHCFEKNNLDELRVELNKNMDDLNAALVLDQIRTNQNEKDQIEEVQELIEEPSKKAETPSKKNIPQDMRVDLDKVDRLIELIEELGVVSAVLKKDIDAPDFDMNAFHHGRNKLSQVTSNLQDVAMSVRLVPLGNTFKKMNRLVFDVSTKLNKKVRLSIAGENTEIDKNMVEAIQDPLVHIFRNAIDHGIESPEERSKANKPDEGLIELKAWHSGGEVLISIQDDGKGIDPAIIKRKAVEKGILTQSMADSMDDSVVPNLVMEPGFSTAEVVTDFSGRGVGMDVVKQSIEKLNGSIHIESHLGFGTTFLLSLPLTSTIVEGMLVKVGDLTYTIRIASIRESFKASKQNLIYSPDGSEQIHIRDQIFPVFRLSQLNKSKNYCKNIEDGILVLVESQDKQIALFVDYIIGTNQSVLKGLPEYFGRLKGVAGCSVIGTGSADISWTVDINSLF